MENFDDQSRAGQSRTGARSARTGPHATPITAPPPPIDLRSGSLFVLAVVASVYMLHWAKGLFIPLMVGVTLSVALTPVMNWMERWRLPRVLGAGLLLFGALGASVYAAYALADDAAALIETLPEAAQKVRDQMQAQPGDPQGTIPEGQEGCRRHRARCRGAPRRLGAGAGQRRDAGAGSRSPTSA